MSKHYSIALSSLFLILLSSFALTSAQIYRTNPTSEQTDIDVLNYALTLENLESAFYDTFLPLFNATSFTSMNGTAFDYIYFTYIQAHERAHVMFLTTAIASSGVTDSTGKLIMPVTPCRYNFSGVTNLVTFVQTAALLENTGTSAYDGAIQYVTNPAYRTAGATIATVEARHAAFLNLLIDTPPFGNATMTRDIALTPAQVLAAASAFIVPGSCAAPVVIPVSMNTTTTVPPPPPTTPHRSGNHGNGPRYGRGDYIIYEGEESSHRRYDHDDDDFFDEDSESSSSSSSSDSSSESSSSSSDSSSSETIDVDLSLREFENSGHRGKGDRRGREDSFTFDERVRESFRPRRGKRSTASNPVNHRTVKNIAKKR